MSAAKKKKAKSASRTAWTVVAILAVLAVVIVVAMFILARGGSPAPAPSPTQTATDTPTLSPTPTPTATQSSLEQAQTEVAALVTARNSSGLVAYMGDTVQYVNFGSDGPPQNLAPAAAANQIGKNIGKETWGVTDIDTVSAWKATPFAEYFPDGSLQMNSDKDHFLSFIFDPVTNKIVQVIYGTGASLG